MDSDARHYSDTRSQPDVIFQNNAHAMSSRRLQFDRHVFVGRVIAGNKSTKLTDQAVVSNLNVSPPRAKIVVLPNPGASGKGNSATPIQIISKT
jgi:hypothetical protein